MAKQQLPPALAGDERFSILCELLEEAFADLDLSPMLVYLVDIVPTHVLPHLADQFHVMGLEGWRFARNVQERRELIKRAIELHRYKGTPWAIEQVLATLNLNGRVSEWFEYGGSPYRFRVDIDLNDRGMDETTYAALIDLIREYKNKRSRLDRIRIVLTPASAALQAAGVFSAAQRLTAFGALGVGMSVVDSRAAVAAALAGAGTASLMTWGTARAGPQPSTGLSPLAAAGVLASTQLLVSHSN